MKGGGKMTTFEALSLVAQFSLAIVAMLTFIVTIVVFLNKKKQPPPDQCAQLLLKQLTPVGQPLFMRPVVVGIGLLQQSDTLFLLYYKLYKIYSQCLSPSKTGRSMRVESIKLQ